MRVSSYAVTTTPFVMSLKLLRECNHRVVLFNNKTKSATQKAKQATELLKLSDIVMDENGGQPYSNELFREAQARAKISSNLKESIASSDARNKEVIESLKRDLEKARAEQIKFSQMLSHVSIQRVLGSHL
eukprot:Gb_39543 [translate_table: standard]